MADLLGGPRILSRRITSALDAHELLLDGQPGSALTHFVRHLLFIQTDSLEKAFGMSLRTFQRRKDAPDKPLSQEQRGRTWKFAKIWPRPRTCSVRKKKQSSGSSVPTSV
ncbi:putative toxin-antitoxin system antitoxin component (TIGR02293 family) [Bradyrhizobium sp. LB7.2]